MKQDVIHILYQFWVHHTGFLFVARCKTSSSPLSFSLLKSSTACKPHIWRTAFPTMSLHSSFNYHLTNASFISLPVRLLNLPPLGLRDCEIFFLNTSGKYTLQYLQESWKWAKLSDKLIVVLFVLFFFFLCWIENSLLSAGKKYK